MIDYPFVTSYYSRPKTRAATSSSLPAHSSRSQFVIDPVCGGCVKTGCLSSSEEDDGKGRKVATVVWLAGKWRGGKKSCVLYVGAGRRFQWQRHAPSTQSFDLSGNEFTAKGSDPAPEMFAPLLLLPPCPLLFLINCHLQDWNASICSLRRHPPHLSFSICKQAGWIGYIGNRMNIWNRTKAETQIYLWCKRDQGRPEEEREREQDQLWYEEEKRMCIIATGVTTLLQATCYVDVNNVPQSRGL